MVRGMGCLKVVGVGGAVDEMVVKEGLMFEEEKEQELLELQSVLLLLKSQPRKPLARLAQKHLLLALVAQSSELQHYLALEQLPHQQLLAQTTRHQLTLKLSLLPQHLALLDLQKQLLHDAQTTEVLMEWEQEEPELAQDFKQQTQSKQSHYTRFYPGSDLLSTGVLRPVLEQQLRIHYPRVQSPSRTLTRPAAADLLFTTRRGIQHPGTLQCRAVRDLHTLNAKT
ncbi:hypothetical protein Taro_033747 [Colocasia esculenta]|uniref:Uncharacterized protein n=1 Tax=Colocasia esculenta TaxID=4460 RepID=A0A843W2B2_COLES|nr:hypothetical protein [Colocasia esculenta]